VHQKKLAAEVAHFEDSGEASIELNNKATHKVVGKMKSKVLDKTNSTWE
jgi:hypothetical protein